MDSRNNITTREQWLLRLLDGALRELFAEHGAKIPDNVRVSCAWPSRRALSRTRRRVGEAWCSEASADGFHEIMVSMCLDDPMDVAATLAHECVHVTVGLKHGHRGPFKHLARGIGLEGRMTSTVPGEAFKRRLEPYLQELGAYPHAKLDTPECRTEKPQHPDTPITPYYSGPPKQSARLIKAQCATCGYTIRLSRLWISHAIPCCPDRGCADHDVPMTIENQIGKPFLSNLTHSERLNHA